MEKKHVYEKTYKDYLSRIAEIDLKFTADKLDLKMRGKDVIIPFLSKTYRVSPEGIADSAGKQPHLSVAQSPNGKYAIEARNLHVYYGDFLAIKDVNLHFCADVMDSNSFMTLFYMTIDPEKPALPISHPFFYAVYLAKKFGPYATLGLAEDTTKPVPSS